MLPVVDLDASDAAGSLAAGLRSLGFVQLVNHVASPRAASELRTVCDAFFALSDDNKRAFTHDDPAANRGYRSKGSEALSYSLGEPSPPDLFESFNCADDRRAGDHPLLAPTPWPDEVVSTFSAAAGGWLAEMERLANQLDALIDETLGTDLAERSDCGPDTMACIDYRPGPDGAEASLPGQQRMGAHSDYTTFTILDADPVTGLQIVTDDGWVDVIPEPGALLLNVGDLLAMLTNDTWPSTLHRVVPMDAGCAPQRRSVAYFHYPNLDVEIAPLARFGEPRYGSTTVAEHLLGKLTAPKTHEPATGTSTVAGRQT